MDPRLRQILTERSDNCCGLQNRLKKDLENSIHKTLFSKEAQRKEECNGVVTWNETKLHKSVDQQAFR